MYILYSIDSDFTASQELHYRPDVMCIYMTSSFQPNVLMVPIHQWNKAVNRWFTSHGPPNGYAKLRFAHAPGMLKIIFPRQRLQRKPLVSDPGMHHGTYVTHVQWCMSGSLNSGGIPGTCATLNFAYLARGPCYMGGNMLDMTMTPNIESQMLILLKQFRYWKRIMYLHDNCVFIINQCIGDSKSVNKNRLLIHCFYTTIHLAGYATGCFGLNMALNDQQRLFESLSLSWSGMHKISIHTFTLMMWSKKNE